MGKTKHTLYATATDAHRIVKSDRQRLGELEEGLQAIKGISDRLDNLAANVERAGEVLIGVELAIVREALEGIAVKLYEGRTHKTHAELDEMMQREFERERGG